MKSNKPEFDLQLESQIIQTDRSPDIAAEGQNVDIQATGAGYVETEGNLKTHDMNVRKISIKVSKDGPVTNTPSPQRKKRS